MRLLKCIGGPNDGERHSVSDNAKYWEVHRPLPLFDPSPLLSLVESTTEATLYEVVRIRFFNEWSGIENFDVLALPGTTPQDVLRIVLK